MLLPVALLCLQKALFLFPVPSAAKLAESTQEASRQEKLPATGKAGLKEYV